MIPLQVTAFATGDAIMLVGVLAILLVAIVMFRNPAAGVLWSFSVLVLAMHRLIGISRDVVWMMVVLTSLIVLLGIGVRWSLD